LLGFGNKVNVRFNFRHWQMQAGMQVSSATLFVSLSNRVIIEKALSNLRTWGANFQCKVS